MFTNRLSFLLTVSSILGVSYSINIANGVLDNWLFLGPELKHMTNPQKLKLANYATVFESIADFLNDFGQWIFIFGYWNVANEVVAVSRDQALPSPRKERGIKICVGSFLFLNYLGFAICAISLSWNQYSGRMSAFYLDVLTIIFYKIVPILFILTEAIILCIAL